MIINENSLRRDILATLRRVDVQIADIEGKAEERGVSPELMVDERGHYIMAPLLLAKMQGLVALTQLQAKK